MGTTTKNLDCFGLLSIANLYDWHLARDLKQS
jgi:hypothetical protein